MAKDTITVFDTQGQPREIAKPEFAEKILPKWLEGAWNDANALAQQVVFALNEGLHQKVEAAAVRLNELDAGAERGRILMAATLAQNGKLAEAEGALRECIAARGESATSMVNLARVVANRGDQAESEKLLAKAMQLDSNNENALGWSCQLEQQRGGEGAPLQFLERLSKSPTNWRAKLWLASHRMKAQRENEALELYRGALPAALVDSGALLAISGDLGKAGRLAEMVELCLPHFDERRQRPETGFNIATGLAQLGRKDEALALIERMRALNLPPLKATIEQFVARLNGQAPVQPQPAAAAQGAAAQPRQVEIRLLNIECPLWVQALAGAKWLVPDKDADAAVVSVFTLADEAAANQKTLSQIDEVRRRMSRSLALYLAESITLRTKGRGECVVPIVPGGAVVVAGTAPNASVLDFPRNGPKPRFLLTGVLARDEGGYRIEFTLYDGTSKAEVHRLRWIGLRKLDGNALKIEDELLDWLATQGIEKSGAKSGLFGKLLNAPKRGDIGARVAPEKQDHYLLALERLREQFVIALGLASRETVLDEREQLDTYFDLCKAQPQSTAAQVVAAAGTSLALQYGSTSAERYRTKLEELTKAEGDARGPLHLLAPLIALRAKRDDEFEALRKQLSSGASESYAAWLKALKP